MSEVQPNEGRKACLIVALIVSPVILCVVAVFALAAWLIIVETPFGEEVLGLPSEEYSPEVIELGKGVEAEMLAAQRQLELDRANLPADCPLPKDWRFDEALTKAWLPVEEDTIYDLSCCAYFTMLGGPEEDIDCYFEDMSERVTTAHKEGTATELELYFLPAGRDRDMILGDFRDYVMQAEYLDLFETAIDYGVARHIPPEAFESESETLDRLWMIADLLQLRMLYALEEGDVESALKTCYRLHQFARPDAFPYVPYWNYEQLMDYADGSLAYVLGCGPISDTWRQRFLDEYDHRPQHDEIEAYLLAQTIYDAQWYDDQPMFNEIRQANQVLAAFREAAELLDPPLASHRDEIQALLSSHHVEIASYEEEGGILDEIVSLPLLPKQAMGEQLKETLMDVEYMSRFRFMKDVARTAFALEDYRAENGQYPEELAALVPEFLDDIPKEPVFRDSLSITLTEDGYELWLPFWSWYYWEPPFEDEEPDPDVVWTVRTGLFPRKTP